MERKICSGCRQVHLFCISASEMDSEASRRGETIYKIILISFFFFSSLLKPLKHLRVKFLYATLYLGVYIMVQIHDSCFHVKTDLVQILEMTKSSSILQQTAIL